MEGRGEASWVITMLSWEDLVVMMVPPGRPIGDARLRPPPSTNRAARNSSRRNPWPNLAYGTRKIWEKKPVSLWRACHAVKGLPRGEGPATRWRACHAVKGLPRGGDFAISYSQIMEKRISRSYPHDCDHYSRTTRVSRRHMTGANETA